MKNNDLDKFIMGKLDEQSFEYNPGDWENALKLIKKEDENNRLLWIWWAAAGLALLLSVALFLGPLNNVNQKQIVEAPQEKQINPIDIDKNTSVDRPIIRDAEDSNARINNHTQIEEALVLQTEKSVANDSNILTVEKEVVPKTSSLIADNINLPDPISGNNPKLQPISSPVSESVADERAGEDFSSLEKNEIKTSVSEVLSRDKFYDRTSIMLLTNLDRIGVPLYNPQTYEWETPYAPQRIRPALDPEVKLGFGWGISAYANPYVANVDGAAKKITGFSGGLTSLYRLDKTISLNADILYTYKTGTFDKSNASETRRYSFEALDGISSLNPTALHYASLPIYAGLHFGKHRVTLGGSLNYLAAVRGDVLDQTVDKNGAIVNSSSLTGWIPNDGFTKWNTGALIGYDFNINNRWIVSFRSNYMFNSIIDKALSSEINSFIVKENSQVNLQIGSSYFFK